ncbi:carbohydrate-binding domain-containing protein [Cryptobacterium curtum]|uniref:carbohydrate-binding domain-containing protein n=1 Tax=Cryptobacterium curtum TaxID=84163 RepID=UPI00248F01BF|nr:carbohydrate-binding domain-containing protein [Cryptobacterium curtum]
MKTNRRKEKSCAVALSALLVATVTCSGCSLATNGPSSSASSAGGIAASATTTTAAYSDSLSAISNIAANTASMDFNYTNRDTDASWDASTASTISFSSGTADVSGSGVEVQGSHVTITAAGTYVVSGTSDAASIVVAAGENNKVQIVLDGVQLTGSDGPCITVSSADKVFLTLADGTDNVLSDASTWTLSGEDGEANATVYSASDLTINGSGSLTVNATTHNGITSKDDLKITDGTITVDAANTGLRGKDSVRIAGGTVTVTAQNDGIKSDNDEDADKGFISIDDGTVTVVSQDKALNASQLVRIAGGTVTLNAADDAIHSDKDALIAGGTTTISAGDDGIHAEYNTGVSDGAVTITRSEEGLEAQCVEVAGGEVSIASDDDGINASVAEDTSTTTTTTAEDTASVSAAQTSTAALQDGLNTTATSTANTASSSTSIVSGPPSSGSTPNDSGASGAPGGQAGPFGGGAQSQPESSEACAVVISGGTTVIENTLDGDGIDSNGSIWQTGGTVYISGSTQGDNSAIDSELGAQITGGSIVAVCATGMQESFNSSSTQASITATYTGQAESRIDIQDAQGTTILSYTARNAFGWILASSPAIQDGAEYSILVDGVTVASVNASTQQAANGQPGMAGSGGGPGGGPDGDSAGPNRAGEPPDANNAAGNQERPGGSAAPVG